MFWQKIWKLWEEDLSKNLSKYGRSLAYIHLFDNMAKKKMNNARISLRVLERHEQYFKIDIKLYICSFK